ncbi:hypothetical protein O181_026989 [Austropuccinia psidii MF-1]|uniref:Uncharacterized protein n=1 Tax=Austropuccinia psidii MF-1 TaxID=1389203 RepID=A0A9Q3CL15_9BASI|nr:hypothetical protein [Austropuccinia psidii MF-1]
MPIQHSPPARQTRSQARAQAVLTPTPRAPLDGTPEVPQLRAQLDRGPHMQGAAPSRKKGRGPRRSSSFSGVVGKFPGNSRTIFYSSGCLIMSGQRLSREGGGFHQQESNELSTH